MGNAHKEINETLADWISRQHLFFVATSPLSNDGHINCSPKGGNTFRIINSTTVAFLDLTGSGAETIAHVRENGRMVIMFCAFEGAPLIVRLYGKAEVLLSGHSEFSDVVRNFPENPGTRSIIRLHIDRVSESCGMAVPQMKYESERTDLDEWAESKGPSGLTEYRKRKNQSSIDQLPALDLP